MTLIAGTVLGPYEVVALLGAGGMGEVYRAKDTRLGREVALKVLREEVAQDPDRLRRFEQEARAVAALNHPHILTVHDVGVHEGMRYVVTELLEGESLREVLLQRLPTQRQALLWGVQTAQGLSAAHQKGVVHRDLKPENLFLTTDGRIKILDFGLAKLADGAAAGTRQDTVTAELTKPGAVMGTVAYMSPEQAQAWPVDARSDIFSFGVVLYELLSGRHPFRKETAAATLSAILQETPPPLTSVDASIPRAVDGIVARCLEKRREERFQGAHDLGLALETALAVPAGSVALEEVEERSPYPGLASFTEKDASVFFGREAEVKALWERIRSRPLLAVIGPSGAGKTSFVRAGVIPARPRGWGVVWATPGPRPVLALSQSLVPELAGDTEAMSDLLRGIAEVTESGESERVVTAARRWRTRHGEALLVLDQFEELFTLSTPKTQARFASLLGRLIEDAGVHVLLSLRDDFLIRCSEYDAFASVFESLTPLPALSREDLQRALVEPAGKRGYRFEDEALVEEMVGHVEGERAALPMLAFTVSRLWEKRDREKKLLTRQAYEEIGGVAGALAQHAEATLERIGSERQDMVREIFRNLVTAQGTRAVIDREELLSAFPDRFSAEEVLRKLGEARLLTFYEVEGREGEPGHHRVEVAHESLLKAWPRLVRWQAQDEEGALLRDQLKQAAHLWEEKGRTQDLLWTGTAYQEFDLWRARYPGALTAVEEDFAKSMADRARRRKRVLVSAVTTVIVALAGIAVAIGISRQQATKARDLAVAEAARREAAQLLALGRLKLADSPSAALAYTIASLERGDNDPARRFAVEALWQGPPTLFLQNPDEMSLEWGPGGRWIASSTTKDFALLDRDTGERRQLATAPETPVGFTSDGKRLVSEAREAGRPVFHVWTLPEGLLERTFERPGRIPCWIIADRLLIFTPDKEKRVWTVERLSLDGASRETLGRWATDGVPAMAVDSESIVFVQDGRLLRQRFDALTAPARVIGTHDWKEVNVETWHDRAVTGDVTGDVRIWDLPAARLERTLKSPASAMLIALDPGKRFLATGPPGAASLHAVVVFELTAPRMAEPMVLPGKWEWLLALRFSPDGSWLAAADQTSTSFFSLTGPRSIVLGRQEPPFVAVAFTRDGHLLSTSDEGVLRRWPHSFAGGEEMREYRPGPKAIGMGLGLDRQGRAVLVNRFGGGLVVPLDGSEPVPYLSKERANFFTPELDATGRFLALSMQSGPAGRSGGIVVFDLDTHEERALDTRPQGREGCQEGEVLSVSAAAPVWLRDGGLVTDGAAGLRVWNVATGTSRLLRPCKSLPDGKALLLLATPDSRSILRLDAPFETAATSSLSVYDLVSGQTREIASHGNVVGSFALDASGKILVSGDKNGVVRVGLLTGEEPHLLFGHTAAVTSVAVSPDGRSIASGSDDGTIRLWPMPDLSKAPLHTLAHGELLAKLKSLTNMRAVRDPGSDTGWKTEIGPFPGWGKVPHWQP
jgi:WD40 repeat protein